MQSTFPQSSTRPKTPLDEMKPQGTENIGRRLADSAQAAIDRVAEKTTPAMEKFAESAKAVVGATVGKLETVQGDAVDSVRNYVRDRPFTALAAATLVGVLASHLLSSRSYRE